MKEFVIGIATLIPQLLAMLAIFFILLLLAKKFQNQSKVASVFLKTFGKNNAAQPSIRTQVIIFSLCSIVVALPLIYKFGLSEAQQQKIVEWIRGN